MSTKILIVDDEPTQLLLITHSLEKAGYEIIIAQSGKEALNKVQTEQPDLVILDVLLPDISGIEVCQQLRSRPETIDLPIIMLSAQTEVPEKIMGLEAGADEYVTKPISVDEMVVRVRALLDRTRRLRMVQRVEYGKVLGFIGAKGGVGTTTVALNTALTLVKHGRRVTAVELRSHFGSFALYLGVTPTRGLRDLLEKEPERIDEGDLSMRLIKHPSGLQVLIGPQQVHEYSEVAPDLAEAVVKGLARMADYVVIDLPCYPAAASRVALRHCDAVALVVEAESTCVTTAKTTLELLDSWGVSREIVRVAVVNPPGLSNSVQLHEIRSYLACEIVGAMPAAPELCMWAQKTGRPLMLSEPNSLVAISLADLTYRLVTREAMTLPH